MEKTTEFINLRKIIHRIYCDNCDVEMKSNGMAHPTYPPTYGYSCPKCHKETWAFEMYPWSEIVGDEVNEHGMAVSL